MSTTRPSSDPEDDPRAKSVVVDIRAARKSEFIDNLWCQLASDPALLERIWAAVKSKIAQFSNMNPLTSEMVYIAVSAANGRIYCAPPLTAGAKTNGMTPGQHGEPLSIVALAAKTNFLAGSPPVDATFDASAPTA